MKTLLEQYNFNVKESNDKEILLCVGGIFKKNWNVLKKRMDYFVNKCNTKNDANYKDFEISEIRDYKNIKIFRFEVVNDISQKIKRVYVKEVK